MPRKEEYWKNPEKWRKATRAYAVDNPEWKRKSAREWAAKKRAANPGFEKEAQKRWRDSNPDKRRAAFKAWTEKNPDYNRTFLQALAMKKPREYLLRQARNRAQRDGLAFNLTLEDIEIPEFCPVLGVKLGFGGGKRGASPRAPSLDKVVPTLGYVRGNVRVISYRANTLKSNAAPEEIAALLAYVTRETLLVTSQLSG